MSKYTTFIQMFYAYFLIHLPAPAVTWDLLDINLSFDLRLAYKMILSQVNFYYEREKLPAAAGI